MRQAAYTAGPLMVFQSFWRSRQIIWAMAKREVIGRYRGSFIGILWAFLNPLLMLGVYTFVFGVVFRSRWGKQPESYTEFGVMLFAGLIVYTIFAEGVNRAPSLILNNANYVKKVIFPLESLAWSNMGSTLFHGFMSAFVLLLMHLCFHGTLHWTAILFPVVIFPILLLAMGFTWFLASLGVFLRDLGQVVGIFTTTLMFMSALFYPPTALPESLRLYVMLNPLSFIMEQVRAVLIRGELPNWLGLGACFGLSMLVAWLGLLWFEKTRKGFADVI